MSTREQRTRPVEVTVIEKASFQDLVDIGLDTLAHRDATVVNRLDEPGLEDFLKFVGEVATDCPQGDKRRLAKASIRRHPFFSTLTRGYLRLAERRIANHSLVFQQGYSPDMRRLISEGQEPHFDENALEIVPQVTMNTTLYTAGEEPWEWGLSGDIDAVGRERDVMPALEDVRFDIRVALETGGSVILGENARINQAGKACTVLHEVLSPEESWDTEVVQRVRLLQELDR